MRGRIAVLAVVFLAACNDGPTDTALPLRPQASVQGVSHFSFLPPLAAGTISGAFNPDLRPSVVVCWLQSGACVQEVARFDTLTADVVNEQYKVNWQIKGVAAGELYRVSVFSAPGAGAQLLGSIDLLGTEGGGLADPATGESRNVQSTLPVKFRLEEGILCTTLSDDSATEPCVVMAVGPAGGTVVNEDSTAGAYFPAGALDQWVNVTIERFEPGDPDDQYNTVCLPTSYPQYGGCFRFRTDPDLASFQPVNGDPNSVTVGVCPDPAVFQPDIFDQLDLYKWDEVNVSSLVALPPRNVTFLNCPGSPFYTPPTGLAAISRLPQPFRSVLQLLAPAPVFAGGVSPYGAGLSDFSRIGWVRTLALARVSGDGQQEYVGLPVPNDPVVRVTAAGSKVTTTIPVGGVPIQFVPSADGAATPGSTVTDANGYASTVWTLGMTPGAYTLEARGQNPLAPAGDVFPNQAGTWGTVTFTATAVATPPPPPPATYTVVFSEPLQKGKLNKNDVTVTGVPVQVQVCSVTYPSFGCQWARRVVDSAYRFQWKADATNPAGTYRFSVLDFTTATPKLLGSFTGAVGKEGSSPPKGVDFVFQLGSTVPIKFVLVAK